MRIKPFILGALAYVGIVFPLAVAWHLVLFRGTYDRLHYFTRDEPLIALGLLAIAVQGLVLSYAYPFFYRGGSPAREGTRVGILFGVFHWTSHVVAEAAKHSIAPLSTWFLIETIYLVIEFGLYGLALGFIYGRLDRPEGYMRQSPISLQPQESEANP